jgi:hypothetical protein
MATFRAHKVVASLPDPLDADTVYLVRVGEGFDLYATDSTGLIAHRLNPALSWMDYAGWPSVEAGTVAAGAVRSHTRQGVTVYRLIPEPYDDAQDAFYNTFSGGVLSGLIVTRG